MFLVSRCISCWCLELIWWNLWTEQKSLEKRITPPLLFRPKWVTEKIEKFLIWIDGLEYMMMWKKMCMFLWVYEFVCPAKLKINLLCCFLFKFNKIIEFFKDQFVIISFVYLTLGEYNYCWNCKPKKRNQFTVTRALVLRRN